MASSPTEQSAVAFALQELTACWDQAYEAMAQGDLDRVQALLEVADRQLHGLPGAAFDTSEEARMRQAAVAARGRLEHGMRSGLEALADEIGKTRHGARALAGYRPGALLGDHVSREA